MVSFLVFKESCGRHVSQYGGSLDVLALESYVSSSRFQRLKFLWWWGMALMRWMVKKGRSFGMI